MTEHATPRRGRIIAVANQKGGVGKTTTAINLGTGIAQANKRCLLVDLDPQGNASTGLGSHSGARTVTMYDALADDSTMRETIIQTSVDNLFLAPGSVDLSGIDVEMMDEKDRVYRLRTILAEVQADYDYILIDCPPSLNLLTVNAMVAADTVIVPLQCEFFALEGLSQLLGTVRRVQANLNPDLRIEGIVLTMFDQRNRLSFQVAEDVKENLGEFVFETVIPRNVRLSEAPSHAIPALVYDASCAGSVSYRALADELLSRDQKRKVA